MNSREKTQADAERWAEKVCTSTEDAFKRIFGHTKIQRLTRLYPQLLVASDKRVRSKSVQIGGGADVDLLYAFISETKPVAVLETGVARGYSSLAILKALDDNGSGTHFSIDRPDMRLLGDGGIGCAVPNDLTNNWRLLKGTERDLIPFAIDLARDLGGFSFCHYDSDKSYYGRAWAYSRLWKALNLGGFLVSDDISDNTAFKDFCEENDVDPVVVRLVNSKYVGIAKKAYV